MKQLHPLLDFMVHLFLAAALLAMLAFGIVLMLIFTIVDGIARIAGPVLKRRK